MMLASADATMDLCKLANMADRVMEVAIDLESSKSEVHLDANIATGQPNSVSPHVIYATSTKKKFWEVEQKYKSPFHLGKCPGQSLTVTCITGPTLSQPFYVGNIHTHTSFFIYPGSEVSAILHSISDHRCSPDTVTLTAVNSNPIHVYGKRHPQAWAQKTNTVDP